MVCLRDYIAVISNGDKMNICSANNAISEEQLNISHVLGSTLEPDRISMLHRFPTSMRIAELGVNEGDYSQYLLEILRPSKFFLVDLWQGSRFGGGGEESKRKIFQRDFFRYN